MTIQALTLDQQSALHAAAVRLRGEFSDRFGTETIQRFLQSSYDQFADRATITNYLPLLAERFARQRLTALARIESTAVDGPPIVLFLCVHNAGRSQMAMGFLQHLAGDGAMAWSGGSEPGGEVNAAAVAAMAERGIDISAEFPKPWTDDIVRAADVVVTMGCGDACPIFPREALRGLGSRGSSRARRECRPPDPRRHRASSTRPARRPRHPGPRLTACRSSTGD